MDTSTKATLSVAEFVARYGISKTKVFAEIKNGRLIARKFGRRTLIPIDSAEAWLSALDFRQAG